MTDWVTISALATAGGTLVLAVATFSSVRSANRAARTAEQAARTAERSFQVALRPVLFPSRPDDPPMKIRWGDNHWAHVDGGRALVDEVDGAIYLAMSLRNVGAGIAVIQGWLAGPEERGRELERPDPAGFHTQVRDLYVPAGDSAFWQAGIREPGHPSRAGVEQGIQGKFLIIDILYSDHEGGQRTISRFSAAEPTGGGSSWLCSVIRHWNLDRTHPR